MMVPYKGFADLEMHVLKMCQKKTRLGAWFFQQ